MSMASWKKYFLLAGAVVGAGVPSLFCAGVKLSRPLQGT